ncbi:pancreatic triacylglycerol lipase-like [Hyla sarda]|uniref:pancreatic triacylglycerol lipase-like n=1 Tax=Hyla sarda TaxID=327740 RepID=UPI0024C37FDF|nr:pancreatic triacylglycerol lipase-like [Hyla sarda]XP_056387348.1 pancreatic triacylglycerol lipase-like [Hyla sarda]XP_056387349.1 pancreatic triacylglycerol lipase-like [Hyla sarda]
MIGVFLPIIFLVGAVKGGEVCFSRIGCFSDLVPYAGTLERPISKLPWAPEKINVRFLLFTKSNANSFQEVNAANPSTISASNFATYRKTRFIIHGFIDKGEESWLMDMCKTMLQVEDVNCFCVDWSGGSRTLYSQAANNIRVVGAEVAYFINVLSNNFGYSPGNVHVIGHSLGAHAAGEVGKRRRGIARITGLDPAEPYFQGTPAEVRLDPSDAAFVDVIHTDGAPMIPNLGLGMSQVAGHIDFYPNGGEEMPGCSKNALSQIVDLDGIWQGTRDFVACNHLRSYKYYTESIRKADAFIGFPTTAYSSFKSGSGFPCPSGGCPSMGHFADSYRGATGQKFYLNTGDQSGFARWRYKVTVQIAGSLNTQGYFHVSLFGPNGNTRQYQIYNGYINTGNSYTAYIDVETDVGPLNRVKFVWNNGLINPLLPTLGASTATVQYGKDGKTYKFCGSGTVREEVLQTLNPC